MNSVLVADSNGFFRRSFKDVLQVYLPEITVREAENAEEAMIHVRANAPDLIFMDVRLKGKSGLKLGKEIKDSYPGTIVCVFADYDLPEYRKIAYQHGVDHCLLKDSLSGSEIAGLIKSTISQKASGF
jgi:DNA-binding NarL/FixJ family response regulator